MEILDIYSVYIFFLFAAVYLFGFCLFLETWRTWFIALVLVAPAYVVFSIVISKRDALAGDPHGFPTLYFFGLVYPPVAGHLARAASLFAQSRGLSRGKALGIDLMSFLIACGILVLLNIYWFGVAAEPLEKIE